MARVPFPSDADLPEQHRGLFDQIARSRGQVPDLFRVLAHSPDVLLRRMAYGEALRRDTVLDERLRELAILTVARLNGSGYEFAAHERLGRQVGLSDQEIAGLADYATSAVFGEREWAVMRYAEEVTASVRAGDDTWSALAAFLDHRQLVELVLIVAWYNQTARVTFPLRLDS